MSLLISRSISRYSQTSVVTRPNAAYHSMPLGRPALAPFSMKSKSTASIIDARPAAKIEKPMLNRLVEFRKFDPPLPPVNRNITNETR